MRGVVLQRIMQASLLLIVAYGMLQALNYIHRRNVLPIATVQIEGSYHHVTQAELRDALTAYFPVGFFSVNTDLLKQRLLEDPWIDAVTISRKWPETLKINISEQQPVARWGATGLINAKGDIFYPNSATIPADLPVLYGPQNQTAQILLEYQRLSKILAIKGFSIAHLEMADSWAWKLQLTNGLVILLGSKDASKRIHRFLDVYNAIFTTRNATASLVDLRYQHGMAVKWEQPLAVAKPIEKVPETPRRGKPILD